jgi:glutathione S-transferase
MDRGRWPHGFTGRETRARCFCRRQFFPLDMIELFQFPWSPFCLVQKRILEYSGQAFKVTNIPSTDRSLIWRLTRQRYYQVPVLRDGHTVVFETDDNSQVIAKYLDEKLKLGLFPPDLAGVQDLIWLYLENQIEEVTFKLNDAYWCEFVPAAERVHYLRHKERKFGRGCLERWRREQPLLRQELARRLLPFEQMLQHRPFLLDRAPRFVDFDLYGMLSNLLYTRHHRIPAPHARLRHWYQRISAIRLNDNPDF